MATTKPKLPTPSQNSQSQAGEKKKPLPIPNQGEPEATGSLSALGQEVFSSESGTSEGQPNWVVLSIKEAQTAPLENLKDSIEYYRDFYGDKGLGSSKVKFDEFNELVKTYNSRAKKEAPLKERMAIIKSDAYNRYIDDAIANGDLNTQEFGGDFSDPQKVFEAIAKSKSNRRNQSSLGVDREIFSGGVPQSEPQVETEEDLFSDFIREEILSTIPKEERTPEQLALLEDRLFLEGDMRINLNPEDGTIIGTDKSRGVGGWLSEKGRRGAKVLLETEAAIASSVVDLFAPSEISDYLPIAVGGMIITPAVLKQKARELDKKLTQYDSDVFDDLANGRIGQVANRTVDLIIDSAPTTALAIAAPNPASAYALISLVSGNQYYDQVKNEEWFKNLSGWGQLATASFYGGFESIGEVAGGKVLKNAIKGFLSDGVESQAKKSFTEFAKQYAKSLGIAMKDEGIGEGITGVGQLITESAAKGNIESLTLDDLLDTFIRQGTAGLLSGVGTTTGVTSVAAVIQTPKWLNIQNKQKELIKKMTESNNIEEKSIYLESIEELQKKQEEALANHQKMAKSMSQEDMDNYMEAIGEFNINHRKLKKLEEKGLDDGAAAKILKEKMSVRLKEINEITNKYEGKTTQETTINQEEDAIQERSTEEVPVGEQTEVSEGVLIEDTEGGEATTEGQTQEQAEEEVTLKYKPTETPSEFSEVEGGKRMFGEAANAYNKSLDRRQGETKSTENALDYIKGSKAYENATDVQREAMIRAFRKGVDAREKSAPSADRVTGKPKDKEVTVKEKTALKDQIKLEVRAAREGYKQAVTEVKDFTKRINSILKNKDFLKSGVLTPSQTKALANAALGVRTPSQMRRFQKTANRIIEKAEYADKLNEAKFIKSKLKKGLSKLPTNVVSAIKDFSRINPSDVSDIDAYIEAAKGLLAYKQKPKTKVDETGVDIEVSEPISIDDLNDYINSYNKETLDRVKKELLEENNELVQQGVIDEKMSLADIEAVIDAVEGDSDAKVFPDTEKGNRKREGFKRVISNLQADLKNSKIEAKGRFNKDAKEGLENVDIDQLSDSQLSQLYIALQNANINGRFNGAHKFFSILEAQKGIGKLESLYKKAARNVYDLDFKLANWQNVFKAMTGSSKSASEVRRLMGIEAISNGRARAEQRTKELESKVEKLGGSLFGIMGKFSTIEENSFLSTYASLLTVGVENFQEFKKVIQDMIDNDLKTVTKSEKETAKVVKKMFNERIAPYNSLKEIKLSLSESKMIDVFLEAFSEIKSEFKDLSESVYNIEFEDVQDYLPLLWKKRSPEKVTELRSSSTYSQNQVKQKKDGSLNKRNYKVDPSNFTLDFDFIHAMIMKYKSQVSDIETAAAIEKYNAFYRDPRSAKAMGGQNNKNSVHNKMLDYVNSYMNFNNSSKAEQLLFSFMNGLAKLGARMRLGGLTQIFAQSVPVLLRAHSVLGRDVGLLYDSAFDYKFKDKENFKKLISQFPIGTRGFLKQEFESSGKKISKSKKEGLKSVLKEVYGVTGKVLDNITMRFLEMGDVGTAEMTWMAFYLQDLKKRGLYKNQSMEELAKNPDEQAAAYAEQMVGETQVPSDVAQSGSYFSSKDDVLNTARRVLFPFISFRANQSYSIATSLQLLAKGEGKEKKDASKELAGVFAENSSFALISLLKYNMALSAATVVLSQMGIDMEEDDEEEKRMKYQTWVASALGRTAAEFNPMYGYIESLDSFSSEQLNKFYFWNVLNDEQRSDYLNERELLRAQRSGDQKRIEMVQEKAFNNFLKSKYEPVPDFSKMKKDDGLLGMFGAQLSAPFNVYRQAEETVEMSTEDIYKYLNNWNSITEKQFSDKEKDALMISAILQFTNFVLPKELGDVGRRMKSEVAYGKPKKKKKPFKVSKGR